MTRPSTKPNAMKPTRNCHELSVSKPQIQPLTAAHTKSVKPPTNPSLPAESRDNVNCAWQDTQVNVLTLRMGKLMCAQCGAPYPRWRLPYTRSPLACVYWQGQVTSSRA